MVLGKIRRVGNSLVVTVPKEEAEALGLHAGDLVAMELRRAEVVPVLRSDLRKFAEESWQRDEAAYRYLKGE